jgi:hypothetical protein
MWNRFVWRRAASRKFVVSEDLGGPQRQPAFSSYLDRIEGAPQHNAPLARADAGIEGARKLYRVWRATNLA